MTSPNSHARPNNWLSARNVVEHATIRLFCLPHAGSGTAMFNLWKRLLPAFVEVCPILLPGREGRLSEPSITDSSLLIDEITSALGTWMDKPYAIFGHSMGSLLALDLAQHLVSCGMPAPSCLFLSGRNATHVPMRHSAIHKLSDPDFLDALAIRYGGLPQEILDTPELLELYLPILRADLTLLENHQHRERPRLACPIAAFAGKEDRNVSAEGLQAWGDYTTGPFTAQWFEGDHFYLSGASRVPLLKHLGALLAALPTTTQSDPPQTSASLPVGSTPGSNAR